MGTVSKTTKPRGAMPKARRPHQTDESAKAASAEAPKVAARSKKGGVRIGALSIAHDDLAPDEVRVIDLDQLVEIANAIGRVKADVILLCGVRVDDDRNDFDAVAQRVAKTFECPVLVEWKHGARTDAWWLVTAEGVCARAIRTGQYVVVADDVEDQSHLVFAEFEAGYGRIDCMRGDTRVATLALFICGEARMLSTRRSRLFKRGAGPMSQRFFEAFEGENNILLHPSHRPYRSQIARTGGNLVARWKRKTMEPVLSVAVRSASHPGARPFRAAVHAGPYYAASRFDRVAATLAFERAENGLAARVEGKKRRRRVTIGGLALRYAEFVV